MGALTRPDLPPGPHRDLVDSLHALHHGAGWPSLRALAKAAGVSHTTVSKIFSTPSIPSWGTLEVLVETMGGDTDVFRQLWLAATTQPNEVMNGRSRPAIVGRRPELAALARHLSGHGGLVLVSGEAGIGKTTLVEAAATLTDACVCSGHGLPLSIEVPLMPLADVLRAVYAVDGGTWLADALSRCEPHVSRSLAALLPSLGEAGPGEAAGEFARHRLFTSVLEVLGSLAARRPLALLLEDLHWADGATLDWLEYSVACGLPVPVVATWRTDDAEVSSQREQWLARVQRNDAVDTLELSPFTRAETAAQLQLMSRTPPDDAEVERIHSLSQGLPLYTDQLISSSHGRASGHLAQLIAVKIGELSDDSWRVSRALAVAGRPLPADALREVTGLDADAQFAALAALSRRRLLRTLDDGSAALAHPLLVGAFQARLLPGEAAAVHADIATVLERDADTEPGELARHWEAAGRPADEIGWRLTAAKRAKERHASAEALDDLKRVLELRKVTDLPVEVEPWEVLREAMNAANRVSDLGTARKLADEALALDLDDAARVRVLELAGHIYCRLGDSTTGLVLLDQARNLIEHLPPSPDLANVLITRLGNSIAAGRYDGTAADCELALELLADTDTDAYADVATASARARVLMRQAWLAMVEADHDRARDLVAAANAASRPGDDPFADLMMASSATDILLNTAAAPGILQQVAAPALQAARTWHIQGHVFAVILRYNVAEAYLRAGDIERSAEILQSDVCTAPTPDTALSHLAYAEIELLRGDTEAALERCAAAVAAGGPLEPEAALYHAEVELWTGDPEAAAARLDEALSVFMPTDTSRSVAPLLALFARAHADMLDQGRASAGDRMQVLNTLRSRASSGRTDPFGHAATGVMVPAWKATWRAELTRVDGTQRPEDWVSAATAWDHLHRPHEAAYCRWRAADAALTHDQGTLARRLLTRAGADARRHAPLTEAIMATSGAAALAATGPGRSDGPPLLTP